MFGSRARVLAERVMSTAEISSLMLFKFWIVLARCGPPASHPTAPPSMRATSARRAQIMQSPRLDSAHISNRKCNDNQGQRDRQHIAHDAGLVGLARPARALDNPSPVIHGSLRCCATPLFGNGKRPVSIRPRTVVQNCLLRPSGRRGRGPVAARREGEVGISPSALESPLTPACPR